MSNKALANQIECQRGVLLSPRSTADKAQLHMISHSHCFDLDEEWWLLTLATIDSSKEELLASHQNGKMTLCYMIALVNGFVKCNNQHSSPTHNLYLTHESKTKHIVSFSGHDRSVEWFCEMQQPPQQSSTQSVSYSWEETQTPNTFPAFVEHDCSVEWFCEMKQPSQQSSTQSVSYSLEQKQTPTHCQHLLSMIALLNGFVKCNNQHSFPLHNLFLTHESRSLKQYWQHLLIMIALLNGFVKCNIYHSSPIQNLFLTQESKSKPKNIGNICWAWLLCSIVLWNATTTTVFLYTICFSLMRAEAQNNIGSIGWSWLLCWMVLWNATTTTAFLYTICF